MVLTGLVKRVQIYCGVADNFSVDLRIEVSEVLRDDLLRMRPGRVGMRIVV